jgi:hypothetical protein
MTEKLIIIGAPRSGTNMVRDLICTLPGLGTWPCDEINFIWRHGNVRYPSDVFPENLATDRVRKYVRSRFDSVARSYRLDVVVEKTCANSLRVGFVDRIVPDARYVFLVRHGMDAVASAAQRWRGKLDVLYTLKKARFVPLGDVPRYAALFAGNRLFRLFSRDRRVANWGPRLENMQELLSRFSLEEVCALQWRECVERAAQTLANVGEDRVLRARYESVVDDPRSFLAQVADFLRVGYRGEEASHYGWISPGRIGAGRDSLTPDARIAVERIIAGTLECYGYAS